MDRLSPVCKRAITESCTFFIVVHSNLVLYPSPERLTFWRQTTSRTYQPVRFNLSGCPVLGLDTMNSLSLTQNLLCGKENRYVISVPWLANSKSLLVVSCRSKKEIIQISIQLDFARISVLFVDVTDHRNWRRHVLVPTLRTSLSPVYGGCNIPFYVPNSLSQ
jgi:hypothetical protein